ncbi:MAG: branched-chain amino acid ABC transporter permease [Phototrophicales bacterium]|nr:MAG: branched-chain amino acid ABC transporter permease [Phototrophicales bacterium]
MDYVTAIVLLGATIIILDWFVPQVVGNQEKFIQLTYNGFSQGILLALIALGLVLIYKATDVINFAHGEIMMLGAYIFAELIIRYKASLAVAIVVAALLLIVFGALIERLVLRPLIGEPIISVIMVTIGLSSIIEALVRLQWRSRIIDWQEADSGLPEGVLPLFREIFPKDSGIYRELSSGTYPLYSPETTIPFPLRYENVYLTIIAAIFIAILILFFKYSKHGIAMRATADDQQAALSMGISVKRIFAIAWGIAALFAGIAGVLSGDTGTGANTGIPAIGLRAFPVIILGGLDSIVGAVIGGIVIGLLQSYSSGYLDPWLGENAEFLVLQVPTEQVLPYIVLIVVLMFRPYGLFGQQRIERV